jgi:hypothetical protein
MDVCFGRSHRTVLILSLLVATTLTAFPSPGYSQGTVDTTDGLTLSLSPTGAVSSLQLNGSQYASPGLSGFAFREATTTPVNAAPNGSFESGSATPTSWSWGTTTTGTWTWDTTTAAEGTRSMKIDIPGTIAQKSPNLISTSFSISPNTPYTFSCQMRSSGVGGSYSLSLYLVEQDSSGTVLVQRSLDASKGTSDWLLKSLSFTTSPTAAKAYLYANVYSGYGTIWVDNISLSDVFGGAKPLAFGGTVTSDASGFTQAATINGLSLVARFTSVGTAVKVDATLQGTTGADRAVELSFRLPLNAVGWSWENTLVSATPINAGTRYYNLDYAFKGGQQTHSVYPFATVRNATAAFSLAVPMGPQMERFNYDTVEGFRVTWDLGLSPATTKNPSQATVSFWLYTQAPRWGFRATAQKYYALNPASFTSPVTALGAWVIGDSVTSVPNPQDFAWAYQEAVSQTSLPFDNTHNILALRYVDPSGWFRDFSPTTTQPSYDVLISTLNTDATSSTLYTTDSIPQKTMAQAVINSSPYNADGLYQVNAVPYFWYGKRYQIYPTDLDPDIPAPSLFSLLKQYSVDAQIAMWKGYGLTVNGIFLDDLSYVYTGLENYRRSLWAYSDLPLSFSYASRRPMLFTGFSLGEGIGALRSYLDGQQLVLMGSCLPGMLTWYAHDLDLMGGEVSGAEPIDTAYLRRTLGYGKGWSNLRVGSTDPTATEVLAYFRQGLLLGYFPGFNSLYWGKSTLYERDRVLFQQYMPLIRQIVTAGWQPINYTTSSDPAILVERFDDEKSDTFFLTAQNTSTTAKTIQLTLDGAGLGISSTATVSINELVTGVLVTPTRDGSGNLLLARTLSAGETQLYKVTITSTTSTTSSNNVAPNWSFETGTTLPSNWTLGTSSMGTWTWDSSTAEDGQHSAKLVVSGTTGVQSPTLVSGKFSLNPNISYIFSAWMKSSGVGGLYPPYLYVVELDANGAVLKTSTGASVQHGLKGPAATSGWTQTSLTFKTDPRCAKAYIYANIYNGYGTVWVDAIKLY